MTIYRHSQLIILEERYKMSLLGLIIFLLVLSIFLAPLRQVAWFLLRVWFWLIIIIVFFCIFATLFLMSIFAT